VIYTLFVLSDEFVKTDGNERNEENKKNDE